MNKNFIITLDNEKLEKNENITFKDSYSLIYYISSLLYELKIHNKNLTKKQDNIINTLFDIFECIK